MPETPFYATGRRKRSIARVWLFRGQKGFLINGEDAIQYLHREALRIVSDYPLRITKLADQFRIRANVHGGGKAGQAGAISLGIARALIKSDESLRPVLKQNGLLTRDPREKERKKFGRKSARRSFQYTKR